MRDFFAFRFMITPVVIRLIFFVGLIVCVVLGLAMMAGSVKYNPMPKLPHGEVWAGLGLMILGPFALRLYCETLILFFRMNETLNEISRGSRLSRR